MYEIRTNPDYNSREVYFDGKPAEEIRDALKALKMRWHSAKKCWYGYASESALIAAINDNGEAVKTDGYLGGGAYYGANSNKALYGADLSAAIRASIKAAGIKGVSVSVKSYSGGQSITATVKLSPADMADRAAYIANYRIKTSGWIYYTDKDGAQGCIFGEEYYSLNAEEQERIREAAAAYEYDRATKGITVNQYHINSYTEFSSDFLAKLHRINDIILSYNYDNSNSMVDYFDTNFYYDIDVKKLA